MKTNLGAALFDALKFNERVGGGVGLRLHDRDYPRAYRPAEAPEPELPAVFRTLPDAILKGLPFQPAATGDVGKEKLFDLYHESIDHIVARYAEAGRLLHAVAVCGVEVRGRWTSDKTVYQAMRAKAEELRGRLPEFDFEPPGVLSLELYTRSTTAIVPQLYFALADAAHRLVKKLADVLDLLVDLELVGLLGWKAEDACEYHFFRNVLLGAVGPDRTRTEHEVREAPEGRGRRVERVERTTAERDVDTTHRHARHVSQVVAAKNYLLSAAGHVKRPGRVDALVDAVPAWLLPCMRVVTGKQTAHVVIERDLRTDRAVEAEVAETVRVERVYRPDPALVCGMYVLAGWDDEADDPMPALTFRTQLDQLPPKK